MQLRRALAHLLQGPSRLLGSGSQRTLRPRQAISKRVSDALFADKTKDRLYLRKLAVVLSHRRHLDHCQLPDLRPHCQQIAVCGKRQDSLEVTRKNPEVEVVIVIVIVVVAGDALEKHWHWHSQKSRSMEMKRDS